MKMTDGLYFSTDHEWIKAEGERAYIGISDYAQKAMGDIVYVELPELDAEFTEGEIFGSIESVKAASDVLIPVSGKIIEINEAVVDDPSLLNQDPYENWMIYIEMGDNTQLNQLMNSVQYKDFCSEEA